MVYSTHVASCDDGSYWAKRHMSRSPSVAFDTPDGMEIASGLGATVSHTYSAKVVGLFGRPPSVCSNAAPINIMDDDVFIDREPRGLCIHFSQKVKDRLHQPWANALIIKLIGVSHSYNYFLQWSMLKGHWQ